MKLSTLLSCESTLVKLFNYGYLLARQNFYLSSIQCRVIDALDAYHSSRNALLNKYGTSQDGQKYDITGENIVAYHSELAELESQDVDISFPEDKITLCIDYIEKTETDLPSDKRLGFSARDWATIQEVIKVVETEG